MDNFSSEGTGSSDRVAWILLVLFASLVAIAMHWGIIEIKPFSAIPKRFHGVRDVFEGILQVAFYFGAIGATAVAMHHLVAETVVPYKQVGIMFAVAFVLFGITVLMDAPTTPQLHLPDWGQAK